MRQHSVLKEFRESISFDHYDPANFAQPGDVIEVNGIVYTVTSVTIGHANQGHANQHVEAVQTLTTQQTELRFRSQVRATRNLAQATRKALAESLPEVAVTEELVNQLVAAARTGLRLGLSKLIRDSLQKVGLTDPSFDVSIETLEGDLQLLMANTPALLRPENLTRHSVPVWDDDYEADHVGLL